MRHLIAALSLTVAACASPPEDRTFERSGARIVSVAPGSGAAYAGLQAGDRIAAINQVTVIDAKAALALIESTRRDGSGNALILVYRGETPRFYAVPLRERDGGLILADK